jgi:hypothetical protein
VPAHVLATATAISYQLSALPAGRQPAQLRSSVGRAVQEHLRDARIAAWPPERPQDQPQGQPQGQPQEQRLPVSQQFVDWWTGASVEAAYLNLHEAEIALAQLLPDDQIQARIPEALARLETMDVTDPRRLAAEAQLAPSSPRSQRRAAFHGAVKVGLELKDQQYNRLRGFRNVVPVRVNLSEADSLGNHCVVAGSSFGWLIHTAVGSAGGSGGLRTKRSGWVA